MSVKLKSYACHNKPEPMLFRWQKGFFNLSSYKREKGWPKCAPDPWTHCSNNSVSILRTYQMPTQSPMQRREYPQWIRNIITSLMTNWKDKRYHLCSIARYLSKFDVHDSWLICTVQSAILVCAHERDEENRIREITGTGDIALLIERVAAPWFCPGVWTK